jgi:hypothetical protein
VRSLLTFAISSALLAGLSLPGLSSAERATPGRASWALTGSWHDAAGNPYQLTQKGPVLTWSAHALDNKTWAHKFAGEITDNTFSGTYEDEPGFSRQFHGAIKGTIRDSCHMDLTLTVTENGDRIRGSLTRPCAAGAPPTVSAITSYGPWTAKIKLRFRVWDDSRRASVKAVLYAGRKAIRAYAARSVVADGRFDTSWYYKPAGASRREADLEFCVTATNGARRAARDCAALSVHKP